ncbi:MAG: hypothetical protein WC284_12535 [Candidimonas sp.]
MITEKTNYVEMLGENDPIIEWAKKVLVSDPLIVWFLRIYKLGTNYYPEDQDKLIEKNPKWKNISILNSDIDRIKTNLEHYMSMQLPKIKSYRVKWQTPDELFHDFQKIEDEWTESLGDFVNKKETDKIILDMGNFIWFNLGKQKCDDEAEAMGHCGNRYGKSGDILLSLREKTHNPEIFIPRLTFVINDGYLGEMKGFANNKPSEKYHPYIVKLLELPMIKGIIGGGYEAHKNFSIEDLPENEINQLIEKKPLLGPIEVAYEKMGESEEFIKYLEKLLSAHSHDYHYSHEKKVWIIKHFSDVKEMLRDYGNDVAKWAIDVILGNKHIEVYHEIEFNNFDLPEKITNNVEKYIKQTYPDEYESDMYFSEIVKILKNNDDGLYDILVEGIHNGIREGTYDQIKTELIKSIDHSGWVLTGDMEDEIYFPLATSQLIYDIKDGLLEDEDYFSYDDSYYINIKEPHYGFDGYDEEVTVDYIVDNFPINIEESIRYYIRNII